MASAAKALHLAIEEAVQQLEPQLLPLFGTSRYTRDQAVRPTQRTQVAMKMLVALTRFFPEEHRVRRAGEQLELIWPPLVHEPRGQAAGKLLHSYFRLRQDLLDTPERTLLHSMRELAQVAIEGAQLPGAELASAHCDRRLRTLAGFLPPDTLDLEGLSHLGPFARLFFWQQALEASSDRADAGSVSPLLLPDMLATLDHCIALCRASDWNLDYFCNSGLVNGLWQLRGMARFGGNPAMAELFEELDDECLDMHLAGARPRNEVMQQWLVRLFGVVHERSLARAPQPDFASAPELPFRAIYDQELTNYRRQLQEQLHGELQERPGEPQEDSLRITSPLITVLYKLTWVFAAAEQPDWARLCHCAYRVALQHWRVRRPVNANSRALLLNLALKPGTLVPGAVLRQWRRQLLQDWPAWTDDGKRPIALRPDHEHVVALEAVPDLLSGSFTALVQAGRLTDLPSAQACQPFFQVLVQDLAPELLQELALLEKGAAAMKVWPLEQLCTLLIAVYETHLRDEVELPAALLQDAHRQLVRMLDQAAAWHEVQSPPGLVLALELWLKESFDARAVCREPRGTELVAANGECEPALRAQVLSCLGTLAPVLERPVRLQLDAGKVRLDPARLMQVLDCLRPLIKFMLLDQSVDARTRYAMHKPRISTLAVTLRATSATLVITVGEDTHEDLLPPAELQRLQRRLPKRAGTLVCESRAGRGRAFTFTLG